MAVLEESPPISQSQQQTSDSFGYKWAKREAYDSDAFRARHHKWLWDRYFDNNQETLNLLLERPGQVILDAGCGAGFSGLILFGPHAHRHRYIGVDIAADAIKTAKQRFKEAECPAEFICSSLMDVPLADASVDVIFSEGVLHHTDSTKEALCALSRLLRPGGTFLFYVYAKKAITREFVDDHIRDQLKGMSNDEAWEALYPLTKLGIALGELNVTLDVPDDIPMLGIKKGPMPLQRFLYWNFFKAFYSPELDLEEMNHLNFDWYRPLNCHRHSKEEVLDFCQAAGLKAERVHVEEAGITVCARKTA